MSGDVPLHGTDISAYRGDSRIQPRLASPHDESGRSLGGKARGGRQANTRTAACNDGSLSIQLAHVRNLSHDASRQNRNVRRSNPATQVLPDHAGQTL